MSLRLAKLRRLARDAKGIALIEFALSLPIIMALTFGAIDVARLVINRLTLQQASAEVASLIIVRPPEDDGDIMVLATPSSPTLDRHAVLSCPWRPGDVW